MQIRLRLLICWKITSGKNAFLPSSVLVVKKKSLKNWRVIFSARIIDLMKIKYISDKNMSIAHLLISLALVDLDL